MPNGNIVIEAFTELAPTYEATIDWELRLFWGITYRQFLDQFIAMAHIQAGKIALDVATGTAYIPSHIAGPLGTQGRVWGLDITPAMLQRAANRLAAEGLTPATRLVCGSGMAMPLADDSFDVVLCGLGTHHMDVPRLLAEITRVLRPGGQLILADVAATTFWRSPLGWIMLRILLVFYGLALRSARARAETEAFANIRTAHEWRTLLAGSGYGQIALAEIRARHRWYPGGVILRAVRLPAAALQ